MPKDDVAGDEDKMTPDKVLRQIDLLAQAQDAVRRADIDGCRQIVALAAAVDTTEEFVPALCALLERPSGSILKRRAWRSEPIEAMRLSAIDALRQYNSPKSATVLAATVLFGSPMLRERAADALCDLGSTAAGPMLQLVVSSKNWPLDGMLTSIKTISHIGDPSTIRRLPEILLGNYPVVPRRWLSWQAKRGFCVWFISTLLICTLFRSVPHNSMWDLIPLSAMTAVVPTIAAWGFLYLSAGRRQRNEYAKIHAAAVDPVINAREMGAIPGLLRFDPVRSSASAVKEANRGLKALLPLLTPADVGLLDSESERRLTNLFSSPDGDLLLEAVRALEIVGTGQSADRVERLVRNLDGRIGNRAARKVRHEAKRILPILQVRKRMEELGSVLLRSSEAPPVHVDELLRPAQGTPDSDSADELLRAEVGDRAI